MSRTSPRCPEYVSRGDGEIAREGESTPVPRGNPFSDASVPTSTFQGTPEKPLPFFPDDNKKAAHLQPDIEKGGVKPLALHRHFLPNLWNWGFSIVLCMESGRLVSEYMALKILGLDRSIINNNRGFIHIPWPKPEDMTTAKVVLAFLVFALVFALSSAILYRDRRNDRYQNAVVGSHILLMGLLVIIETWRQPWRNVLLLFVCEMPLTLAMALSLSAEGHCAVRVYKGVRAFFRAIAQQ